jgi:lysophospholipase L1-like esterase
MPVTFTVPAATGGQSPVTVTCSAQSGAAFPLGSTIVTCTATDALARQATCNFNVTVTPTPRISKTKFLAFGDSITHGRCDSGGVDCPPYTLRFDELLRERYSRQTFTVTNSGVPGEAASDDIPNGDQEAGQDRIRRDLPRFNPEVVLLMEGTNDLFFDRVNGADYAIVALDRMISLSRDAGATVFVATIAPQRLGGARDEVARMIPAFNDRIRALAASRNVPLVDVYAALAVNIPAYISGDDLHPTAGGHRVIGETFFAAVRAALDSTPATAARYR